MAFKIKEGKIVDKEALTDLRRAIRLACVSRFKIISIATTASIIERHASILRLIKVPVRLLLRACALRPRQRANIC